MYCKTCGSLIEDGIKFCSQCGSRVEGPAAPPAGIDPAFGQGVRPEAAPAPMQQAGYAPPAPPDGQGVPYGTPSPPQQQAVPPAAAAQGQYYPPPVPQPGGSVGMPAGGPMQGGYSPPGQGAPSYSGVPYPNQSYHANQPYGAGTPPPYPPAPGYNNAPYGPPPKRKSAALPIILVAAGLVLLAGLAVGLLWYFKMGPFEERGPKGLFPAASSSVASEAPSSAPFGALLPPVVAVEPPAAVSEGVASESVQDSRPLAERATVGAEDFEWVNTYAGAETLPGSPISGNEMDILGDWKFVIMGLAMPDTVEDEYIYALLEIKKDDLPDGQVKGYLQIMSYEMGDTVEDGRVLAPMEGFGSFENGVLKMRFDELDADVDFTVWRAEDGSLRCIEYEYEEDEYDTTNIMAMVRP